MTVKTARILVAVTDGDLRSILVDWLCWAGYEVRGAADDLAIRNLSRRYPFDVAIASQALVECLQRAIADVELLVLGPPKAEATDLLAYLPPQLDDLNVVTLAVERALLRRFPPPRPTRPSGQPVRGMSPRELEILNLLAEGLKNRDVAERLALKEKTVRNNLTSIFDKLGVTSRLQALIVAKEAGLIG